MLENKTIEIGKDEAFVAFSYPNDDNYNLHLCDHEFDHLTDENLNFYDFLAMPFVSNKSLDSFFKYRKSFLNTRFTFYSDHEKAYHITSKENYLSEVSSLIQTIKTSKLNKVIYSRIMEIENSSRNLGEIFLNLHKKNKDAFVFMYNIPNVGCWIGATPELLLKKKNDILQTVALAGTQKLRGEVSEIYWGKKEIDEQAFIKSFIRDVFKTQKLEFTESVTTTKKAGEVCHIFTEFESAFPMSLSKLILELHPGPAISGSPKIESIKLINGIERHDRLFYTGYLGEISSEELCLYINLRSMEALKDKFLLYVGGGITVDSNVEDEWTETEMKSKTMSSVIK